MPEKVRISALYSRFKDRPGRVRAWKLSSVGPSGRSVRFAPEHADALIRELLESGNFCKDTTLGAIYHRRKVSLREISTTRSLHISLTRDGLLSVHVDRVSPVIGRKPGCDDCRYSVPTVIRHNVTGMAEDFVRLLAGGRGQHHLDPAAFSLEEIAKELKEQAAGNRRTLERAARGPARGERQERPARGLTRKLRASRSRRP